ncbi:unnamed protein product [Rotaria sp. Silwood2]|nr:unnamed protein product [Rotaria sp. Silwood2]
MYWQIDDICQAPTPSTIEYRLKWKMNHYYVQYMYESIYPVAMLTPHLANVTDDNARSSLYVINELFNGATGHLICTFLSLNTFSIRSLFVFDVSFDSPALHHVIDLAYSTLMRNAGCLNSNQCLFHCQFNTNHAEIGQTSFSTQPKIYEFY